MKISLRAAAIFLSLVLSAIPLYSCAADTTPASDTTAPTAASTEAVPTTEERLYPDLPEADFEGYEFTFLSRTIKGWNDAFVHHDLYAEMETGDVINDAVYKRNLKIEEKYNIKIKEIKKEYTTGDSVNTLKAAVSSGSGDFDAILPQPASTTSLLLEGLFLDLNTIPHLGLDQPWWNQNANESLSINDTLYYTFSDLSIMDNNACAGVLFNKQMLVDYGLEDPYQLVRDGKWTYDKVHEMSKAVVKDLNGDGAMKNADDQFGFLGQAEESKEMLDIIFDNIIVDIGIFYDFGGFASTFMQLSIKDNRDVVSVFEKNQPKIQTSIDKFIEGFGNIGQ